MNCHETCRFFGMYQFLSGIEGNVVLLHSVVACHFATMMHGFHKRQDVLNACSTVINDKDIIFSGEDSLEYALAQAIELYQPKSITVLTGCVSEIIKDDVAGVIERFGADIPIQHFEGTGFSSGFEKGYEDALLQYVKANTQPAKQDCSINLIGTLKDDYKLEEDVAELRRILSPQVKINCVIGACTQEDINHLTRASLNVVFHRGLDAAVYLKEVYNLPYVVLDYPYGIAKSKAFLEALEEQLGVDFSAEKQELERSVLATFASIHSYLRDWYHCYVGLYASAARLEGLRYFLAEELGMNVITGDKANCSYQAFREQFSAILPAVVMGSSFEGGVADDLQAPLFPIEYPVLHRISIGVQPYAMGRGAVNLVNDLINMMMILKYSQDKGAFYREKNMRLR